MIERFKDLTERVLPNMAREQHWQVRFDHCFKRICLDNAFEDVWYRHLRRPAERHLSEPELSRAVEIALRLTEEGRPLLELLNNRSLRWRGKQTRTESTRPPKKAS